MVDDNILNKTQYKIKKIIGIKKFDETKILIDTDDKLPVDITFKHVILMTSVVKDEDKYCP